MRLTSEHIDLIEKFNIHKDEMVIPYRHRLLLSWIIIQFTKGMYVRLTPDDNTLLNEIRSIYIDKILKK